MFGAVPDLIVTQGAQRGVLISHPSFQAVTLEGDPGCGRSFEVLFGRMRDGAQPVQ